MGPEIIGSASEYIKGLNLRDSSTDYNDWMNRKVLRINLAITFLAYYCHNPDCDWNFMFNCLLY